MSLDSIYCGSTDKLEREHILPLGLSGTATLPRSTCRQCAVITGNVENQILRGELWPVRVFRDLKSRTKHRDAPREVDVDVRQGDQWVRERRSIDEVPILLNFPFYSTPRHLTGAPASGGVSVEGIATVAFGAERESARGALADPNIRFPMTSRPNEFARMIAKIAYAFAYAEGAIADLAGAATVLPAILGQRDDIGSWVGTLPSSLEAMPGMLHRIGIHHDTQQRLLLGEVQLFADSQTPTYGVILGPLKHGEQNT